MTPTRLPTLRHAFGLLFFCGIAARFLGVLREILIAGFFGVSAGLDAVYLGLAVPLALTVGIGSGFMRSAVPLSAALGGARLLGLIHATCWRVTLGLAIVTAILSITAPWWVTYLAWDDDQMPRRLLVISAILGCLTLTSVGASGILGGIANAKGNHVSTSVGPLVYNAIVCVTLVVAGRSLGVLAIPLGVFFAETSQVLVHWGAVRGMVRGAVAAPARGDLRELMAKFWPAAVMGFLAGINFIVDRVFASTLQEGSIAALSYAYKLVSLPAGLLGMALAVPLYTRLSRFRAEGREEAFHATLLLGLRLLIVAGLPIAALLFWVSTPALGLLLERGAFDQGALNLTATAFAGYAAGVAFIAASMLLSSASLTLARPNVVLWMLAGLSVLNALLDFLLVRAFGLFGLAITTSIVALLGTVVMTGIIAPRLLRTGDLWVPALRAGLLSVLLFLAGWFVAPLTATLHDNEAVARLLQMIALGGMACVVTAVLWPVLLRREWLETEELRGRVAGFVRDLEDTK